MKAFDISVGQDTAVVEQGGRARLTFTVTNVSGRAVRALVKLVPEDDVHAGWLALAGEARRDLEGAQTTSVVVEVKPPGEAPPGTGKCRVVVASEENPDEDFADAVAQFTVTPAAVPAPLRGKRPRRWWIVAAAVGAAVIVAVAWPEPGPVPPPPPAPAGDSVLPPAPAGDSVPPPPPYVVGSPHRGCVEFSDAEDLVTSGSITRVDVWCDGYVHGIRLCYGPNRVQGGVHGCTDSAYTTFVQWEVPHDDWIARVVVHTAPNPSGFAYVGRLRFFTAGGEESPWFGQRSNRVFEWAAPTGWELRTVSGTANPSRHSSLTRALTSVVLHAGPRRRERSPEE